MGSDPIFLALRSPASYSHPVGKVELIETHISAVLLAGEFAYKLKKPVALGFADFSTLERRRHFCFEELRLNQRSAPQLYLDVVAVAGDPPRFVAVAQAENVIDYAVRMRRFADDARLDRVARAGALDTGIIDRLATGVAAFHERCQAAPPASAFGAPEQIARWVRGNLAELQSLAASLPDAPSRTPRLQALAAWTEADLTRLAPTFAARRAGGAVRECHGDLHLANVVLLDGTPLLFDCIEFNDELRFIDVCNDAAFCWMDLLAHELPPLAARFLSGYAEATGDYAGLTIVRFYAAYRALVRAKVALIRRDQLAPRTREGATAEQSCERYLALAEQLATTRAVPPIVLTCGLAGSGKTTVAQRLLEHLGAIRVRSDVERKRLAGLAPTTRTTQAVASGLYGEEATRRTYDVLAHAAAAVIAGGFPAIVDATFLQAAERLRLRALAAQLGSRLHIVSCEAADATLRARIAGRAASGADASDATLAVLDFQRARREPLTADEAALCLPIRTDVDAAAFEARCREIANTIAATPGSAA